MRTVIVEASPYQEDYEDMDRAPPWSYDEDNFIAWVDEVFLEGYKSVEPLMNLEDSIDLVRSFEYYISIKEE